MQFIIDNITLTPDQSLDEIKSLLLELYGIEDSEYRILRKSLDARKKNNILYRYRIVLEVPEEKSSLLLKHENIKEYKPESFPAVAKLTKDIHVIVVGSGPAGLFSALRLIEAGAQVTIFERGRPVDERMSDISILEKTGELNSESNVVFGEGGAGTYSDGKLTARSRRPESFWFFDKLIEFGAPESIMYEARPHLGTDRLRSILRNIRKRIITSGSSILFNERVTDILIRNGSAKGIVTSTDEEYLCKNIILAAGHSARDIYELLFNKKVELEKKGFAMGVRVEHPAGLINDIQYGKSEYRQILPAAEYKLTYKNSKTGRGIYSFCMCPGGSVINSSSEEGMLCTNGMSFSKRDTDFSNSAIVVNVSENDTGEGLLAGIEYQRIIEKASFIAGGGKYAAPAQRISSFLENRLDNDLPEVSYSSGVTPSRFSEIIPGWIYNELADSLKVFNNRMRGFISNEGVIIGTETRTSSPVRISRGSDFQSVNTKGLFPVGEGSGYAGGIVSSAVDGIRAADSMIKMSNEQV